MQQASVSDIQTRLALFQAVSKAVNASLVLEDIFDALGSVLQQFIPFSSGTIVILDETQNTTKVLVTLDQQGLAEVSGDDIRFAGYDPVLAAQLKSPEALMLRPPLPASMLFHSDSAGAILAPLLSKGLVIGAIGLSGAGFTAEQLQLLQDVSDQLAVAVENARLYWQTQAQAGREFLVNQITKAIRQSLEIPEILDTLAREVGQVMGLSRCVIHYWGGTAGPLGSFEYVLPGTALISDHEAFSRFESDLFLQRKDSPDRYNPFVLNDTRAFNRQAALFNAEGIQSLAVFPVLLADGQLVGAISLHQCNTFRAWLPEEITLLKALSEHVSVALDQARLFQEKEAQRRALQDALTELQQTQMHLIQSEKMAVLGQFVAGIAHEVNTPLGTLVANDDTVRRCLEQLTDLAAPMEKYRQSAMALLDVNRLAAERIQEIVKNLRNFARLDESDRKRVDLHEGLEATLLLMDATFKGRIRVVRQYGNIPTVSCFPGLLNQVFMNLLVNAAHSIEDRGTITLETGYNREKAQVYVAIQDTGKGILPEHRDKIFDPGFTTKGVGVGTGLGLALCYKILEKHQGGITVESTVGQGTVMRVHLPVIDHEGPPDPPIP